MLMNPLYLSIMSAMLASNLKCWFTEALSVKCLSHHFDADKYVSNMIEMNNQQKLIYIVYSVHICNMFYIVI